MIKEIVTHNGVFHADEVLAVALLKLFTNTAYRVTRTRDPLVIDCADIVVDVGAKNDVDTLRFDHHQFDKTDPDYGLSSAGLVYRYLGIDIGAIAHLVKEVDDNDVGVAPAPANHFCKIISSFNQEDVNNLDQEIAFNDAVELAVNYLLNMKRSHELKAEQKKTADNAEITVFDDVRVAFLPVGSGWTPTFNFMGKADIAIQWDDGQSCWTVQTVAMEMGSYETKYTLEPTGMETEIFCHKAGFIGKYKTLDFKVVGKELISFQQ